MLLTVQFTKKFALHLQVTFIPSQAHYFVKWIRSKLSWSIMLSQILCVCAGSIHLASSIEFLRNYIKLAVSSIKAYEGKSKQEWIPVGCVPPVSQHTLGGLGVLYPSMHWADGCLPGGEGGGRHPPWPEADTLPPLWTDRRNLRKHRLRAVKSYLQSHIYDWSQ